MDHKKSSSPIRRAKRQSKVLEDFWDCSVCTFRNTEDSFKCLMCDVRKGTSTRKPRLNSALVAQQAATATAGGSTTPATATVTTNGGGSTSAPSTATSSSSPPTSNSNNHHYHKPGSNSSSSTSSSSKMHRTGSSGSSGGSGSSSRGSKHKQKKFARLKNVDRSTAQTREVTVNSVTVVITEYKPKPVFNRRESSDQSYSESNDSRS